MSNDYFVGGCVYKDVIDHSLWIYLSERRLGYTFLNEANHKGQRIYDYNTKLEDLEKKYELVTINTKVKKVVRWQVELGTLFKTEEEANQAQRRHELEKLIDEKLFLRDAIPTDIVEFIENNKQAIIDYLNEEI